MADTTDTTDREVTSAKRSELIAEADLQTRAIMRMEVWKRIAYSLIAVGALLAYWNTYQGGPFWSLVVGIIVMVVSVLTGLMLYLVVERAKANVRAMMRSIGVDITAPVRRPGKAPTPDTSRQRRGGHGHDA